MDGENNGKPYEQMDDLGGFPIIFGKHPNRYPVDVRLDQQLVEFRWSSLKLKHN